MFNIVGIELLQKRRWEDIFGEGLMNEFEPLSDTHKISASEFLNAYYSSKFKVHELTELSYCRRKMYINNKYNRKIF